MQGAGQALFEHYFVDHNLVSQLPVRSWIMGFRS